MKSDWETTKNSSGSSGEADAATITQSKRAKLFLPKDQAFGQAFESFYRKDLFKKGQVAGVADILSETIERIGSAEMLDLVLEQNLPILKNRAKDLAETLFLLTNRHWQQSVNIYLRKLDLALEGLGAAEARFLLSSMREIFIARFGEEIQQKGESYEPLDQIVNRTGKPTEIFFGKILRGFSPASIARHIWEDSEGIGNIDGRKLLDALTVYTSYELRELRTEFAALPDILLAEELDRLLPASLLSDPSLETEKAPIIPLETEGSEDSFLDGPSNTTLKSPLQFHINGLDARMASFFRLQEAQLLLRGKSREQIERIVFHHDERFGNTKGRLDARIALLPMESEQKLFRSFLSGFSASAVAKDILQRIDSLTWWAESEFHGTLLEEALPYQTHGILGIHKNYQGIFPKRALLRHNERSPLSIQDAKRQIEDLLFGLRADEREAVLAKLPTEIAHSIRKEIALFQPIERRFSQLLLAFEFSISAKELLRNLLFFSPEELVLLQDAYFQFSGTSLEDALRLHLEGLFEEPIGEFAKELIARRLQGLYTLPDCPDLFSLARNAKAQQEEFENSGCQKAIRTLAIDANALLENDTMHERSLAHALSKNYLGLSFREQVLLDDGISHFHPEKKRLAHIFDASQRSILFSYREGQDLAILEEKLLLAPQETLEGCAQASTQLLLALEDFSLTEKKKLLTELLVEENLRSFQAFTNAATPEAFRFAKLFFELQLGKKSAKKEIQSHLYGLAKPFFQSASFEHAFDCRFGRFREILKFLASKKRILPELLANSFLYLEGISPELLDELHGLVETSQTSKLQKLFRELRAENESLEEAYDVRFAEAPLRASIDQCEAPLPACCKTILLLMGYDPDALAKEVASTIEKTAGNVCADRVRKLLEPGSGQKKNPLIPVDQNWVLEMYTQVRESFIEQGGESLLVSIARKQLSKQKFREIAEMLFGEQASEGAVEILSITMGSESNTEMIQSLIEFLGKKNPRLRECMVSLYNDYYPSIGVVKDLRTLIAEADAPEAGTAKLKKILGY